MIKNFHIYIKHQTWILIATVTFSTLLKHYWFCWTKYFLLQDHSSQFETVWEQETHKKRKIHFDYTNLKNFTFTKGKLKVQYANFADELNKLFTLYCTTILRLDTIYCWMKGTKSRSVLNENFPKMHSW